MITYAKSTVYSTAGSTAKARESCVTGTAFQLNWPLKMYGYDNQGLTYTPTVRSLIYLHTSISDLSIINTPWGSSNNHELQPGLRNRLTALREQEDRVKEKERWIFKALASAVISSLTWYSDQGFSSHIALPALPFSQQGICGIPPPLNVLRKNRSYPAISMLIKGGKDD